MQIVTASSNKFSILLFLLVLGPLLLSFIPTNIFEFETSRREIYEILRGAMNLSPTSWKV